MESTPDMKHTLYRKTRKRKDSTEEVSYGRAWVWLVGLVLLFILVLVGRAQITISDWSFLKWW
jgi:hypothetical protein